MAGWADVSDQFPIIKETDDPAFWAEVFERRPDVLHQFLGDVYAITKAHRANARGGRRPSRRGEGTMDEVWAMLRTESFSLDPFPVACRELMAGCSLRSYAASCGMHHDQLRRLLNGDQSTLRPSDPRAGMHLLSRIATAGGVHPSYFVEWRQMYVMSMVEQAITDSPQHTVGLFRRFAAVGQP